MKKLLSILIVIAFVAVSSLGFSGAAMAADDSITINSATLVLTTDADSNNFADIGDTITVTATITNADFASNSVTADLTAYGGSATATLSATGTPNGTADEYQATLVISDGGGSAIDVAADNAASAVTISATDGDEVAGTGATDPTTATTNNLGDGVTDTTATNGVDTDAPSNQDTVLASAVSVSPSATVTIVSSGDADNDVWLVPSGTTSFSASSTMTTAASGTATSITAPSATGQYKLFVLDDAGNLSSASSATVGVANSGGGGSAIMEASSSTDDDDEDSDDDEEDDSDDDMDNEESDDSDDDMDDEDSDSRSVMVSIMAKLLKSDMALQAKLTLFKLLSGWLN